MTPSRAYLYSLEHIGIKLGLDQIRALVQALGRPDRAYPVITIAGTNGKGSVTAMVERGCRAAGLRTGRFTSPHLVDLEERFALDGEPVTADVLDAAIDRVRTASTHLPSPPSFFEATTAIAFELFGDARVDIAILEVGLGGRLDATNVADAVGVAITAIDFDHEQYLGHTIEAIAAEKAGVIKPRALVVLQANPPAVEAVVREACRDVQARLVRAEDGVTVAAVGMDDGRVVLDVGTPRAQYPNLRLALRGRHQVANAITALTLMEELNAARLFDLPTFAVRTGIEDVVWPARLERMVIGTTSVLVDGAHNPAGARALTAFVLETYGQRLPLVFGAMKDKRLHDLAKALIPAASSVICTAPNTSRAAAPDDLARVVRSVAGDIPVSSAGHPVAAVAGAARFGSPVIVAGSLYLAGEIRRERA